MVLDTKTKRPSLSPHDKRRSGTHRPHNKSFMKTYWPYLPVFGIVALLVVVAGAKELGLAGAVVGSISVLIAGASFAL